MKSNDLLARGDKVDLIWRQKEAYKTMVGDIAEDGSLLVVMPGRQGESASFEIGDEIGLFYYRQSGRYGMDARVSGFTTSDSVKLVRLEALSEPKQEQRREAYRLPASLRTLICRYTDDAEHFQEGVEELSDEIAYTNDISVSGISLRSRSEYTAGERMLLRVYLNWPGEDAPPLEIFSEVRRVSPVAEMDGYQVGMLFLELSGGDGEVIKSFVTAQQQKRVRQQMLIDGD